MKRATAVLAGRAVGALALALSALACDGEPARTSPTQTKLAGGVAASVGDASISTRQLARIAAAQRISPAAARERAIRDLLWAQAARGELPPGEVHAVESSVLARATLREIWAGASTEPISDAELSEATRAFWTRFDRPAAYRTTHAVVQLKAALDAPEPSDEQRERAQALLAQIRQAIVAVQDEVRATALPPRDADAQVSAAARDPAQEIFREAARSVAPEGQIVLVQPLPFMSADGAAVEQGAPYGNQSFDTTFAAQAAALAEEGRGALSPVFESAVGYHVVMLLEQVPERRVPESERREALRDEIHRVRAIRRQRALLEQLRTEVEVTRPANVDALLGQLDLAALRRGLQEPPP